MDDYNMTYFAEWHCLVCIIGSVCKFEGIVIFWDSTFKMCFPGWCRLEKYLNLQYFLEKSICLVKYWDYSKALNSS